MVKEEKQMTNKTRCFQIKNNDEAQVTMKYIWLRNFNDFKIQLMAPLQSVT